MSEDTVRSEPQGASLTIRVHIDAGGTSLVLRNAAGEELTVDVTLTATGLPALWKGMAEGLDKFKQKLGSHADVSLTSAQRAAEVLREQGLYLLSELFGGQTGEVFDFCSVLSLQSPPLVDLHVRGGQSIPFEILPLLPDVSGGTEGSAQDIFSAYLGFGSVIRRVFPKRIQNQDNALIAAPHLPVLFFRHYALDQSGHEADFFAAHPDRVKVLDTWPAVALPERGALGEFCNRFYDAKGMHQIHHFSCHYQTDPTDGPGSRLTLSDQAKVPLRIPLRQIKEAFAEMDKDKSKRRGPHIVPPLVFFNACGASSIDPAVAATLPGTLLDWKFRAFIGPETRMPDDSASLLARYFYTSLLEGKTIGQSLYEARRNLLYNHNNPLGLLYTLYGNPDLRIVTTTSGKEKLREPAEL
ncbi:MAG: CHAT domain-containing protein [Bryobacteraceae bacterium]|nr:CHAT domain-containing protein [Bryobacteraceae bacterium]